MVMRMCFVYNVTFDLTTKFVTMLASVEKLEDCEVCGKNKAKYTCPKCEVRTCCLMCSTIHKKELECDGIRDKVKFLPIKSMTDADLMSDYCLLQEVGRSVDKYNRDSLKRCTTLNNFLPKPLRALKSAAFRRGIRLEFMPRSFSRSRRNTTRLNWKTNELLWRVEWIFPDAENIKWVTERASENARLSILLENVLEPNMKSGEDSEISNLKSILRTKLQFYRSAGLSGIKVLLKAEKIEKCDSRFYELDHTLTLQENLEQRMIIEFPTILVILSHNSSMYEIIDSDDEEKKEVIPQQNLSYRQRFKGNRNPRNHLGNTAFRQNESTTQNQNKGEDVETDSINLLFHTEFSDSEDEKAKTEKEKNVKTHVRKRKPRRNENEAIQKKIQKVRASVNEFTGICKSDSEDEILAKKKLLPVVPSAQINFTELVIANGNSANGKPEVQTPLLNSLFDSHITDSENEGPEEEAIIRIDPVENEKSVEKESHMIENNNKCNNSKENGNRKENTAIQSIAMNYFSAYMTDSEDEIESETPPKSVNVGLTIPDYKM